MLRILKKYLRIYGINLKNNFVREVVYRSNFLTAMATDLVWIGVEFSLFSVIYANVQTLGGWTKPQVFFFLGVFFAADAVFTTLIQRNFWQFSNLVNQAELDILLTKPVNPVFLALTRWVNLTAAFNVLLGIAIMIRYADAAGFDGGWKWLLILFWLGVAVATATAVSFAFAIWVFWTERSWAIYRMYFQFFQFATKPDAIYPKAIRFVIKTFLPFAFIGSVPTEALLHGIAPIEYAKIALVLCAFFAFDSVMWRKGLRRYQSASS